MDRALFEAHATVARLSQTKLPWETGVFECIFGDGSQVVPSPVQITGNPGIAPRLQPAPTGPSQEGESAGARKRPRPAIFSAIMKARSEEDAMEELHRL